MMPILYILIVILCLILAFCVASALVAPGYGYGGCAIFCVITIIFFGWIICDIKNDPAPAAPQCPQCQIEYNDTINYCEKCGYEFHKACKGCGARMNAESKFCLRCGKEVE